MARSRPVQSMSDDIRQELERAGLMRAYEERPFHQRNDYLSWIARAKRPETRDKRIMQMLQELDPGGIYTGMEHPPIRKR